MIRHLRLDFDEPRATITLDRPDKRNMLEIADLVALHEFIDRIDSDERVRVLVVTGAGERSFCSGFAHGDVISTDWRDNPLEKLINRLEDAHPPTICALNGSAHGVGADLALACDFRIGVAGMSAMMPAARLGVFYNVSGLRRLIARLGPGPARRLALASEEIDARELLRIGFLDYLVAPEDLAGRTRRLADDLAGLAPRAVQGMKRALTRISRSTLNETWAAENILACFSSQYLREGLAAAAQKRKPRFTGRCAATGSRLLYSLRRAGRPVHEIAALRHTVRQRQRQPARRGKFLVRCNDPAIGHQRRCPVRHERAQCGIGGSIDETDVEVGERRRHANSFASTRQGVA